MIKTAIYKRLEELERRALQDKPPMIATIYETNTPGIYQITETVCEGSSIKKGRCENF